jgi:hypothetical protein
MGKFREKYELDAKLIDFSTISKTTMCFRDLVRLMQF